MKILFFPSDIGGGLGHISRCCALAQYAQSNGHECAFVLHNKKNVAFFNNEYQIFHVPIKNKLMKILKSVASRKKDAPLFLTISNLNYQVIRDGFTDIRKVKSVIEQYKEIINRFRPALIISDTNLIIGIVAKLYKIPIVQLVRAGFYPVKPQFIWWEPIPVELKSPDISSIFNPILDEYKLPPIIQAEDLLQGDLSLIPSIPEIEPAELNSDTYYVGPLLVKRPRTEKPAWLEKNGAPLIYVTIGGGASTVGNYQFFKTIVESFRNKKLQVIVSTTDNFKFTKELNGSSNIYFSKWVPGREVINMSDLVIFHGGYGTMMETVQAGKPSIIIPFHSEQESNGRRLLHAGSSLLCKLSESEAQLVRKNWQNSYFTYLVHTKYDLTAAKLQHLVEEILTTNDFSQNSKRLKMECSKYEGAERAFSIISQYFNTNLN